ncbi:MAG: isoprenylcysteine carboxylmethyltransferase family protein [Desulfuromonas sp.]|uniref:methyltransferase family protein n=1 Tax=Desulfuromonas sp. TaxID=892 RepID=UPI000CA7157A|nr:isoprenylcysteine carboxylmethyltransferase family protein [Desulfuromonas sp.]PLX82381.1 MAG: isoprenylcysteine carboxylmethyltransferase family protein [Desulfuromonas sp.]
MKKTKALSEKHRMFLSRAVVAVALFFLCTTQSKWDIKNETITFVLFFIGLFFVGIGSLGRMWCSLYIASYKNKKLVTKGPYSLCRNPLYLFSAIGLIGIGCTTETFTFPAALILLFALYYPVVISGEERRLKKIFGADFEEYTKKCRLFSRGSRLLMNRTATLSIPESTESIFSVHYGSSGSLE